MWSCCFFPPCPDHFISTTPTTVGVAVWLTLAVSRCLHVGLRAAVRNSQSAARHLPKTCHSYKQHSRYFNVRSRFSSGTAKGASSFKKHAVIRSSHAIAFHPDSIVVAVANPVCLA